MKKELPPVWGTARDECGDPSEAFTANREGLQYLKTKMEEALQKGKADIGTEALFDFKQIVISDIHPAHTLKPRQVLNRVMGILALAFILVVIALAVYGGHALYVDWIRISK